MESISFGITRGMVGIVDDDVIFLHGELQVYVRFDALPQRVILMPLRCLRAARPTMH